MTQVKQPNNVRIMLLGTGFIVLAWICIQLPSWCNLWYDSFYYNNDLVKTLAAAKATDPFATPNKALENHFTYQNLMRRAGAFHTLELYYKRFADEATDRGLGLAMYARAAADPFQRDARLEKAKQEYPDHPAVVAVQIEALLDKHQAKEALALCESLPKEQWLKQMLTARSLRMLGEYEKALEQYKNALNNPETSIQVGIECAQMITEEWLHDAGYDPFGQWDDDTIVETPLAHAYRTLIRNDNIQEVMDTFAQATWYHEKALAIFARAAIEQGQFDLAKKFIRNAEDRGYHIPEVAVYQGLLEYHTGNTERAKQILSTESTAKRAKNPEAFHARVGQLLWVDGMIDLAKDHIAICGDSVPRIPQMLLSIAAELLQESSCERGIELLHTIAGLKPKDPEILMKTADGLVHCNRLNEAIDYYASALDNDFENIEARDKLADIYIEQKEKNKAIALYDSYIRQHPDSGHSYARVAFIHHKFNTTDRAKRLVDYVMSKKDEMKDMDEVEKIAKEIREE